MGEGAQLLAEAREQIGRAPAIGAKYQIRKGVVRILELRDELSDSPAEPESIILEIRQSGLSVDLFTFLQRPPETTPRFSYYWEWDNLAVVTISSYENWFRKQIHPNTRTNIRKAEKKGLSVRLERFSDRLAADLVSLFNETPIRRGRRYAYYGWDLEMVKRTWATQLDQSFWIAAYYRESFVGFIKLIVSDGIARTSGTIARESHRDKAPMNALLGECVRLCAAMNIPLLVYGKFTYGRKGETSLTEFKRHNGFQKLNVPRYYVPLSLRGRIGLRLGLHRRLIDVIPGPVWRTLLKIRSAWYQTWRLTLA